MEVHKIKFMTVTLDIVPQGMNVSCWISTEPSWLLEIPKYPYHYTRDENGCKWLIHSNSEMTNKMVTMVSEYAEMICKESLEADKRRKVVNR